MARFFEKYPDYADKAFLSVKVWMFADRERPVTFDWFMIFQGGANLENLVPNGS